MSVTKYLVDCIGNNNNNNNVDQSSRVANVLRLILIVFAVILRR